MKKPTETEDYYERLGIRRSATDSEVKGAYRQQAMKWHPDKNPGFEEESRLEFIAISEAYEKLIGKEKITEEPRDFNYYEDMFYSFFGTSKEFFNEMEKSENKKVSDMAKYTKTLMGKILRGY
jgi:DnaJ-class molecular chaperone